MRRPIPRTESRRTAGWRTCWSATWTRAPTPSTIGRMQARWNGAAGTPELRLQAADVLEPIAAARHDWTGLVRIAEIRLAAAVDPEEKRAPLERIYALHDETLEDPAAAYDAVTRLFELDPEDEGARGRLFRLAALLDRWKALAGLVAVFVDREIG